MDRAKRIMKPFVLRRLKKDVLQFLPKKTEVIVSIAVGLLFIVLIGLEGTQLRHLRFCVIFGFFSIYGFHPVSKP